MKKLKKKTNMNIRPVNGHILIEPLKHDSFISQDKGIYEEIGVVLDFDENINIDDKNGSIEIGVIKIQRGWKVYFDSYLAAKYPKNDTEFFWLVNWSDVRAIETNE